jgi:hydroxymethylglutaryl-CoA lyase
VNASSTALLAGPRSVRLVEVGPRDGLQNEATMLPLTMKLELIERLVAAGHRTIEATAYVSPAAVPQMADHRQVLRGLVHRPGISFPVLVPNLRGLEEAIEDGAQEIAVFTAATDTFNHKNIHCSTAESLLRFAPVMQLAKQSQMRIRGYLSCVITCPYTGPVLPDTVASVAQQLYELGCEEVSLGDTTGAGTPASCLDMLDAVARLVPLEKLAGHFHDTRGQGVANVLACWQAGLGVFDASVGGLGGCPYSPGASGNVATEEVVYLFDGLGVFTGVDYEQLKRTADFIRQAIGR